MTSQIEIYTLKDSKIEITVTLENETVWLNRQQLSLLFGRDIKTIGKHLNNIFDEEELDKNSTVAKFAIVQTEGNRNVERSIEFYNLDVIISIGYRVNSKEGIQFRQWATQRLKDFLIKGCAINQNRLNELGKIVQLIEQSTKTNDIKLEEAKGMLDVLSNYAQSFKLLSEYDSNNIQINILDENITYEIKYEEAKNAIGELKKQLNLNLQTGNLFGNEKDDGFKSSLQSIIQTFDGKYLFPSIEEQAANLLYYIIKNHSFSDGNKRIGAFLFIWFLEKNKHRFKESGELKINDNGLVALALLVAQSNPEEKELLIKLIINLIANKEK